MSSPPSSRDTLWLEEAIELSKSCPPSRTAFSVGAIIVSADDSVIATGYSRETDPHDHAEETALAKIQRDDPRLVAATIYSSLEPCSKRASRPLSCSRLIITAGLPRVVLAWKEPEIFVNGEGAEILQAAGIEVVEISQLADSAMAVNRHLLDGRGMTKQ